MCSPALCWSNKDATSCDLTLTVDPDGKEQVMVRR